MADFWTVNAGSAFLDGASDVGTTAADRPTNAYATAGPTHNLICDRTGFRVAVSEGLKTEWNGRQVRQRSWETRHPMDFMRPDTRDRQTGSPRPEPTDVFIADAYPSGVTSGDL